jgi:hypothetical protein
MNNITKDMCLIFWIIAEKIFPKILFMFAIASIGIINNKLTPVLIYIALNIRVKKIMLISVLRNNEGKIMT